MTSTEKRLDAAGAALTVRERLTLVMRAWLNDEPWDERLVRHVPPEQQEEYHRLSTVVEETNTNLMHILSFELEWLRQLELEASRIQVIGALLERQAVAKDELALPDLPVPLLGFLPDLPLLWGRSHRPERERPASWDGVRVAALEDVAFGFELRADGLLAVEHVLRELDEAFGEPIGHTRVLSALAPCRARLLQIAEAMLPFGLRMEFPTTPSERALAIVHAHVKVETFPAARPVKPRHLPYQEREALEAFEAEQAALLHAR